MYILMIILNKFQMKRFEDILIEAILKFCTTNQLSKIQLSRFIRILVIRKSINFEAQLSNRPSILNVNNRALLF